MVVVSQPIAQWYRNFYGLSNVYVLRNLPEKSSVKQRDLPGGDFRSRFNIPEGAVVFIYQGLMAPERGTGALLKIFTELNPEISHLVLMGYGDQSHQDEINDYVKRYPNIHFQPAVSADWITSYAAGADFGISINNDISVSYRYSLSNKFFEYIHSGLGIIVSDNMEHQCDIIKSFDLGYCIPFDSALI